MQLQFLPLRRRRASPPSDSSDLMPAAKPVASRAATITPVPTSAGRHPFGQRIRSPSTLGGTRNDEIRGVKKRGTSSRRPSCCGLRRSSKLAAQKGDDDRLLFNQQRVDFGLRRPGLASTTWPRSSGCSLDHVVRLDWTASVIVPLRREPAPQWIKYLD
jgi:hypothetical protein